MEDKDEEVFEDDKGLDTTISKSLSTNSLLEDRLVPRSLDLTLVSHLLLWSSLSGMKSKNGESKGRR